MIPVVIFAISALFHYLYAGIPHAVVFDEVYYGNILAQYWNGTYFFDMHPPFVKLLLTLVAYLIGLFKYNIDWSVIGNPLPGLAVALRTVPMMAGTLLSVVIYYLSRRINLSKSVSFTIAILLCLENSLITQSRFLLLDIIMILAGFSAILFYLEYIRTAPGRKRQWYVFLSAFCVAAAVSTKWTALAFPFFIFLLEVYRLIDWKLKFKEHLKKQFFGLLRFAWPYVTVTIILYTSLFAIHFSLLYRSGTGDAFMTPEFQKTLVGNLNGANPALATKGFFGKFFELNDVMFEVNHNMTATHSYSSKWYTWPFTYRSIFYWQDTAPAAGQPRAYIYLLGNPFIYWLGALAMATIILGGLFSKIQGEKSEALRNKLWLFIVIGYLVNYLPFIFIGRVMFLYHYEAALIFTILGIGYLLDFLKPRTKIICIVLILAIALTAFIYWSPLTYGLPITDVQLQARMWLASWR
ncbi:MAG: phospholipid carrier-dependent glycosyltransferase [Candidatus Paceibacterota bacterium]